MNDLLEILQADLTAILQATPALADAVVLADNEGDIEAKVARSLAPIKGGTTAKRGLAVVILLPEVTEAEENLPGPPLLVRCEIRTIENVLVNRATGGTGLRSSQAAMAVLAALHHQVLGPHALYAAKDPAAPVEIKPGHVSHAVTLYARANGLQGPGKPAAVTFAEAAGSSGIEVTGTSTPDAAGVYLPVTADFSIAQEYPIDPSRYSLDGSNIKPASGRWGMIYKWGVLCPGGRTLNEIAPPENYVAAGSQSTASQVVVYNLGSTTKVYWLYDANDGDPATRRWVDAADAGLADQGSLEIPAGRRLQPVPRSGGPGFIGGYGAQWEAENRWTFALAIYLNGASQGSFFGDGPTIEDAVWVPYAPATGSIEAVALAGAAELSLACATAGAEIRYTLDGSYPAPAATLYTAPLASPAAGTVIRAAAYKSGLNPGDVTEILITP